VKRAAHRGHGRKLDGPRSPNESWVLVEVVCLASIDRTHLWGSKTFSSQGDRAPSFLATKEPGSRR